MVLFGLLWSYVAVFVFNVLLWKNIDLSGLLSSFPEFIDPNSFGLARIKLDKLIYIALN